MGRVGLRFTGLAVLLLTAGPGGTQGAEGLQRTDRSGPVAVSLTPVPPGATGEPLKIKVVLDTHSVNLDEIQLESVVLVRSGSGPVAPLRVESATGSGHHREAVVVYPASVVADEATVLEVVVKDVGGVPERLFQWDLPLQAR